MDETNLDGLWKQIKRLQQQLCEAESTAINWADSAGWATGHGDTLADILREMRAQHQEEKGDSSK